MNVTCPSCGKSHFIPDSQAGKHLVCGCGQKFEAPVLEATSDENVLVPALAKRHSFNDEHPSYRWIKQTTQAFTVFAYAIAAIGAFFSLLVFRAAPQGSTMEYITGVVASTFVLVLSGLMALLILAGCDLMKAVVEIAENTRANSQK